MKNSLKKTMINLQTSKSKPNQSTLALTMSIKSSSKTSRANRMWRSKCWHLRKKRTKLELLNGVRKRAVLTHFTSTSRKRKKRCERGSRNVSCRTKLKRLVFGTCSSKMLWSLLLSKEGPRRIPTRQVARAESRRCSWSKQSERRSRWNNIEIYAKLFYWINLI